MGRSNAARFNISPDNDLAPFMTKAGNYLLRSSHSKSQRRTLALVHAGRVRPDGMGMPAVFKDSGVWCGGCDWNITELKKRGFVTLVDGEYKITRAGALALEAALIYLGEIIDTEALLAEVDAIAVL